MRVVLAHPLAVAHCRLCIRADFGCAGLISDPTVDPLINSCSESRDAPSERRAAVSPSIHSPARVSGVSRSKIQGGATPSIVPNIPAVSSVSTVPPATITPLRVALMTDEIDSIAKPVKVRDRRLDTVDPYLPVDDFLPRARQGTKPQPLQRVRHRLIVLIVGSWRIAIRMAGLNRSCRFRRFRSRAGCSAPIKPVRNSCRPSAKICLTELPVSVASVSSAVLWQAWRDAVVFGEITQVLDDVEVAEIQRARHASVEHQVVGYIAPACTGRRRPSGMSGVLPTERRIDSH